jgi:hypothetical protein
MGAVRNSLGTIACVAAAECVLIGAGSILKDTGLLQLPYLNALEPLVTGFLAANFDALRMLSQFFKDHTPTASVAFPALLASVGTSPMMGLGDGEAHELLIEMPGSQNE